jgi:hypothetical protein
MTSNPVPVHEIFSRAPEHADYGPAEQAAPPVLPAAESQGKLIYDKLRLPQCATFTPPGIGAK